MAKEVCLDRHAAAGTLFESTGSPRMLFECATSAAPTRNATPVISALPASKGLPNLLLSAATKQLAVAGEEFSLLGATPEPGLPLSSTSLELVHQARMVTARMAELQVIIELQLVRGRERHECPVCLRAYDDICYPSARAKGAFECRHDVCYRCSHQLLLTAVSTPSEMQRIYRCPLCRAAGCINHDSVRTPDWLKIQLRSAEVVKAKEEGEFEEHQAPLRIRRAAASVAEQIQALQRLLGSVSGGDFDSEYLRMLGAVGGASEVEVEMFEVMDEEAEGAVDVVVDGPGELEEEAEAQAEFQDHWLELAADAAAAVAADTEAQAEVEAMEAEGRLREESSVARDAILQAAAVHERTVDEFVLEDIDDEDLN